LQKVNYRALIGSIRRVKAQNLLALTPKILETASCPRNLSASTLRRLEVLLPSKKVEEAMDRLYEHSNVCLKPGDEGYSSMHLRQGLLRRLWNNPVGAQQAIERAATDFSADEPARITYWAGQLSNSTKERKGLWNTLIKDRPLTFHAALAARLTDTDLKSRVLQGKSQLKPGPHDQKDSINEALDWFKALLEGSFEVAAANLALELVQNHPSELSPANLVFVADSVATYASPLRSFSILNAVLESQPEYLSTEVLQLLYPKPYEDVILKNSLNFDSFLLFGLVRQESAFNPRARSRKNARGLMQILPSTARRIDKKLAKNLFDVENNTTIGARYLVQLIDRFQDTELALAAYNAGEGRVKDWLERYPTADKILFLDLIPFQETRNYVSSILRNNYWYHRLYEEESKRIQEAAEKSSAFRKSSIIRLFLSDSSASSLQGDAPPFTFSQQAL